MKANNDINPSGKLLCLYNNKKNWLVCMHAKHTIFVWLLNQFCCSSLPRKEIHGLIFWPIFYLFWTENAGTKPLPKTILHFCFDSLGQSCSSSFLKSLKFLITFERALITFKENFQCNYRSFTYSMIAISSLNWHYYFRPHSGSFECLI